MKIYVARHGQTELNKKKLINGRIDEPLTLEGEQQAREASFNMPNTIKHIYVSSLKRAVQTARILNEKINAELTHHDELQEVDFGIVSGTPFDGEAKKRHVELTYDWRPSGENVDDVKLRVLKILKIIKNLSGDKEALVVAHGGIIRLLHLLEFGETLKEIENASVHIFDLDKIIRE